VLSTVSCPESAPAILTLRAAAARRIKNIKKRCIQIQCAVTRCGTTTARRLPNRVLLQSRDSPVCQRMRPRDIYRRSQPANRFPALLQTQSRVTRGHRQTVGDGRIAGDQFHPWLDFNGPRPGAVAHPRQSGANAIRAARTPANTMSICHSLHPICTEADTTHRPQAPRREKTGVASRQVSRAAHESLAPVVPPPYDAHPTKSGARPCPASSPSTP
jgi:hypothetical protein